MFDLLNYFLDIFIFRFLADEFNLASPAVLNMLFPLLEGRNFISIPGKEDGKIAAKPGFRFFATQNDSSFAVRRGQHFSVMIFFSGTSATSIGTSKSLP